MTNQINIEQFVSDLRNQLENTPKELHIKTIKSSLNTIEDPTQKSLAESLLDIFTNVVGLPSNIVVLIHGIRTYAQWQEVLKSELNGYIDIKTYPIGYEYFDVFRFWMPYFFRQRPINNISRELRNIRAKHPTDNIIVVAHSFGTYVVSEILANQTDIKIHRLLLCGSIIKNSFKWDGVSKIPQAGIINDCGTKDIWPVLAKALSWGYGSSGRFGFKTSEVEDRYHNLGHSDFFELEFMKKYWVPFILHGNYVASDWDKNVPKPSFFLNCFDVLPIKVIVTLAILLMIYWHDLYPFIESLIVK